MKDSSDNYDNEAGLPGKAHSAQLRCVDTLKPTWK